ncbi:MAG: hypothetical protein CFE44_14510 [Burkholderiales bacterium PBB4]|nr:MAG: hypothetical protein CFE44_14510 [Burkholderiales bacterium PBB4]
MVQKSDNPPLIVLCAFVDVMTLSPLSYPPSLEALDALAPADWQAVTQAEPTEALAWMQEAAAVGQRDAQVILGQWLLDGHGTARQPVEALAWFLKAARQGQAMGMNMAGRCFENGWGGEVDSFIAANWYRQAANKGLDAGMYNYANLLSTGRGVGKNPGEAFAWYRRAAGLGHAKSMTKLGYFYEDGRVVAQDAAAAFAWFERGARGGDFRGKFNYAGMLAARGQLCDALHWLEQVPLTATPGFQRLAGAQLLQSPHPEFRALGQHMLDRAGRYPA